MQDQGIVHTFKRYAGRYTHRIHAMPVVILMPHSACNCRCVMCDIWKGNKNAKQLSENDIAGIITSLKKLDTKRVVMSGGEALLNRNFFRFCEVLRKEKISITLLSTGLTLAHHADNVVQYVDDVIVSLDGDEPGHDEIRNIPGAYRQLKEGVSAIHRLKKDFTVSGRCVIHRLNYKVWDKIVLSARELGLASISFLPADVTSNAFNRPEIWEDVRQQSVLVAKDELPQLRSVVEKLISEFSAEISARFIVESASKLRKIVQYYEAHHGLSNFPEKRCNAPWVSAVVEADGSVRPCFFHDVIGNIRDQPLNEIVNSPAVVNYRRHLDVRKNETCVKCVCSLQLSPRNKHY